MASSEDWYKNKVLSQDANVLKVFLHSRHDLHHLRDHLLSHLSFKNFLLILLPPHDSLQDVDGLQQSLNNGQLAVRTLTSIWCLKGQKNKYLLDMNI